MPDRILRGALGAFLLVLSAACSENVTASLGCPQLCGDQSATLLDTTLTGVLVVDSALTGFPLAGSTRDFTLISQGDSADVRLVMRFDTLPNSFRHPNATADSAIVRVDSARVTVVVDTAVGRPTAPITVDMFDVDTTATDTLPRTLIPLFRVDRLIGSVTFQPSEIRDTLRLPINNDVVLRKLTAGTRLRVGFVVRSTQTAKLRISGSSFVPRFTFRVSPDTLVKVDTVSLLSRTPTDDGTLATVYAMYPIQVAGAIPVPGQGVLAVGGVGGARVFMRFNVPAILVDSVQVVRASLLLQQVASRVQASRTETVKLLVNPVVAGPQLTDVLTLTQFVAPGPSIGLDTVRLVPQEAGLRSIELVNLFRVWRSAGSANSIRAVVMRAAFEGSSAGEVDFVSMEGAEALRPRLRLTYVPIRGFGLP
ncbi:MAG: hypothetical protein ABIP93_16460 [Gemmatimonadaceae bacterium]